MGIENAKKIKMLTMETYNYNLVDGGFFVEYNGFLYYKEESKDYKIIGKKHILGE